MANPTAAAWLPVKDIAPFDGTSEGAESVADASIVEDERTVTKVVGVTTKVVGDELEDTSVVVVDIEGVVGEVGVVPGDKGDAVVVFITGGTVGVVVGLGGTGVGLSVTTFVIVGGGGTKLDKLP
ncbi:hypothetical protein DXG01_008250 [Tephrocybe rancida]|nr:hypothetical protein DXG01_008250 [Tephrocybe rancida]